MNRTDDLSKEVKKLQQEYEQWAKDQCGKNSYLNIEKDCSCEEGYEWEELGNNDNLDCILIQAKEGVSEGENDVSKLEDVEENDDNENSHEGGTFYDDSLPEEKEILDISPFSDVPLTHNNSISITYLKKHGVIGGYADGTFQPKKDVNRAELLKILIEASAEDFVASAHDTECFTDVPKGEWFTPYVCYAKNKNWVKGYYDGSFGPSKTVSKVEAIKIILEAYGFDIPESATNIPFTDVSQSQWFAPYLQIAHDREILEEESGVFSPQKGMSRAGVSENIYRALLHKSHTN